jgi:hypothetical protein
LWYETTEQSLNNSEQQKAKGEKKISAREGERKDNFK